MKTFKRLLSYVNPIGTFLPQYTFVSIVYALFGVVNFTLIIPLLSLLFGTETHKVYQEPTFALTVDFFKDYFYYFFTSIIEEQGKFQALVGVCVIIVSSVFIHNIGFYFGQRILGVVKAGTVMRIRKQLYEKMLALQISYFSDKRKGDLMSRLTNDIQQIEDSITGALTLIIREPLQIFFIFFALFKLSPSLTIFTILFLPISGGVVGFITKKLKATSHIGQDTLGEILSIIDETIGGLRIIKAFNANQYITDKFLSVNKRYGKLLQRMTNLHELASPTSQVLGGFILCAILLYGGSIILNSLDGAGDSALTAPEFIAFLAMFGIMLQPIKSISSAASKVQRGLAASERIFEIIDEEIKISDKQNALELNEFKDAINFKNLDFYYEEGGNKILNNININIPKGKTIALVGPSGGGKSTLIDLIPRFHDPKSGSIEIDGVDLKDYSIPTLRQHMGIVSQEPVLFNDSIYNNIAFGIETTLEEVQQAAKVANAHEFILGLEDGYDTVVGDRGMKLSGGQRQRVTIARAILKNPPILLLDEATSALDTESEKLVQEALFHLMKNRTSIVIAHRLSTIQHADEIYVIKDGEIVEQGNHQQLMDLDGMYRKFNSMQTVG